MINAIIGDVAPYLVAAVVAVLGMFGAYRKGQKGAETKAQLKDHENADEIRDRRNSKSRDQRVREMEGRGFRD